MVPGDQSGAIPKALWYGPKKQIIQQKPPPTKQQQQKGGGVPESTGHKTFEF